MLYCLPVANNIQPNSLLGGKMRIIAVIMASLMIYCPANAAELTRQQIDLMKQIALNCSELPHLTFPRPKTQYDYELRTFEQSAGWVMRDLEKLKSDNPDALNSTHVVRGKPFIEHATRCTQLMETTNAQITKEKASTPSPEAQQKINDALWKCDMANKWIDNPKKYNATYDSITAFYEYYLNDMEEAKRLDAKVVAWKEVEIKQCDQVFVPKYLAMQAEQQQQEAAKQAVETAQKLERQQKLQAAYAAKTAKAKALGYKGVRQGIATLLDELKNGYASVDDVKPYLVEPRRIEHFQVINVVGDYVVYGYHRNTVEYIRIAVVKQPEHFYGEDAFLPNGFYTVEGLSDFVSVFGARQQLLVLKHVSE